MRNVKIKNVVERFNDLPVVGRYEQYEGLPYIADIGVHHVQGVSKGTINGIRYAGFTHSDTTTGKIIFTDGMNGKVVSVDFPYGYHPSGIQFFDRYVFVSTSYEGSRVLAYDVEQVFSGEEGLVKVFSFSHGGTTMGITDFLYNDKSYIMLAVISGGNTCNIYISENTGNVGTLSFLKSNTFSISSFECRVNGEKQKIEDFDTQCVGLLTEESNKIYLLVTRSTNGIQDDFAYLLPICISEIEQSDNSTVNETNLLASLDEANIIGKEFQNSGGIDGAYGTHFRWGAGVEITPRGQFNIVATSRNIIAGTFLNATIWDIIEEPQEGQPNPVGYVTLESAGGYTVEFTLKYSFMNEDKVFSTGRMLSGSTKTYELPAGASDYELTCKAWNGSSWKDKFDTYKSDIPFNCTFRTYGALPNPKMEIIKD